ncbi:MAG: DUF3455 domain-containing protein [Haliea sp.]|nr:MAG: DUF3455 domain-containing protein [Haliea sp.]
MKLVSSLALGSLTLLAACAGAPLVVTSTGKPFDQAGLPAAVQAPSGNKVALELVGKGDAIYECQTRGVGTASISHAWGFVRAEAGLFDRAGKQVGRYFAPVATWDLTAGANVTAKQLATAPTAPGQLPLQLLKADTATGSLGTFNGVTHIQRVNIQGGITPTAKCDWLNDRQRINVPYQADYIFYKPM